MHDAVFAQIGDQDIFISVAAVADWRITNVSKQKLKKNGGEDFPRLQFEQNPDILAEVASLEQPPYCVGFAAESTTLAEHAKAKRIRKGIPMIVGNIGPDTFGSNLNQLLVIDDRGSKKLAQAEKLVLARQLIQLVAKKL